MKSLGIALLSMVVLVACKKSDDAAKNPNTVLKLNECADKSIGGATLRICFKELIADSRCPTNAMCLWQGTAVAEFEMRKNDETHKLTLATFGVPGIAPRDTTVSGYKIEFINLSPYPGLGQNNPSSKPIAEVKVTKV